LPREGGRKNSGRWKTAASTILICAESGRGRKIKWGLSGAALIDILNL